MRGLRTSLFLTSRSMLGKGTWKSFLSSKSLNKLFVTTAMINKASGNRRKPSNYRVLDERSFRSMRAIFK